MIRSPRVLAVLFATALMMASCGSSDGSGTVAPTTAASPNARTTVAPATATSTSTTSTTAAPDPCAADAIADVVDDVLESARLTPSVIWLGGESSFEPIVVEPTDFAASLGLVCSAALSADPGGDHDRLAIAAWTGERHGVVVIASEAPSSPYEPLVRFDLLFEQPYGEWVDEDTWAVSISTGETIIVHTNDYSHGAVAKSFLVAFPEPPSPPPQTSAEEHAFAQLEAAGAQNIGIAEPSNGSPIAAVAFTTGAGNVMIAAVGPDDVFDPEAGYLTGEQSMTTVDGVVITLTLPGPDQFTVGEAAFACGGWGWRLESGFGTPDELVAFAAAIIGEAEC